MILRQISKEEMAEHTGQPVNGVPVYKVAEALAHWTGSLMLAEQRNKELEQQVYSHKCYLERCRREVSSRQEFLAGKDGTK